MSSLPHPKSHFITLKEANEQTDAFLKIMEHHTLIPGGAMQYGSIFHRHIFDEILKNPLCKGLGFYFGINPKDLQTISLVVFGLTEDGKKIMVPSGENSVALIKIPVHTAPPGGPGPTDGGGEYL